MIILYTSPSCSSCRKAKKWLDDFKLPYKEKNLFVTPLTREEIIKILELTENGTDDIVSKRSKFIVENNIDVENMSLKEVIQLIQDHPSVLKRPIIVDTRRLQVGYNDEEIRTFIPRELREMAITCSACPDMDGCESIYNLYKSEFPNWKGNFNEEALEEEE